MRKVFAYVAHHRMIVNIIIILIVLGAGLSLTTIKQEAFPSTSLDIMIVTVIYPGAAPIDVEMNAAVPIEEQLEQIVGVDKYTSTILENLAIIEIELDPKAGNLDSVRDDIHRKMQNVPNMSSDVQEINVIELNPSLLPVYTMGVHLKEGHDGSIEDVYNYVNKLEKELVKLPTVAEVKLKGNADPEVHINVDPIEMRRKYISLHNIVSSIAARNVRATGGDLQSLNTEHTIVTIGEFENPMDVGEVIIRSGFDGQRVVVNDVATVVESFERMHVLASVNKIDGVAISIIKKENADIIDTIVEVKDYLENNSHKIPSNITVTPISDDSRTIKSLITVVTSNLIFGFILIFIILLIFLDTKSAMWTSVGMVLIILMTFIYMALFDTSFNTISLAAIITSLGMVVDNSIVVSENIFNFRNKGLKPLQAIVEGIMDVAAPMLVSSITTIAAFAPILMVTGIMGKVITQFPKVIIFAIIASLFQALFILPSQLNNKSMINKVGENTKKKKFDKDKLFDPAREVFGKIIYICLKWRYAILVVMVAMLGVTMMLGVRMFDNFVLLYDTGADTIVINMDAGMGTPIEKTKELMSNIEDIVLNVVELDEIISLYTVIGENANELDVVREQMDSLACATIYLVPSAERKRSANEISSAIIEALDREQASSGLYSLIVYVKELISLGKAVDVKVIGNDTTTATLVKDEVESYMATIDGVYNIKNNQPPGKTEMNIIFDYQRLAQLGINVATVAQEVRTAYNGTVATSLQRLDNNIDFRVQFDKSFTKDEDFLLSLLIPNAIGRLVRLGDIATIEYKEGLASLHHYNGVRSITIQADIASGTTTSKIVKEQLETQFADISSRYEDITLQFGGEAEETLGSLSALVMSLIVAVCIIYLVLLLQFNKIVQPLIVLIVIPFGLIGVLWAFYLHGVPLAFTGFVGIIGLAGVVVNNGIIMVDFINRIIDNSDSDGSGNNKQLIFNGIINGAKARFRPVVLTSITTVIGLLPTVYGIGGRADIIVPIVMAMAYGLLFATFLTLVFLPCLLLIAYDLKLIKPSVKDEEVILCSKL